MIIQCAFRKDDRCLISKLDVLYNCCQNIEWHKYICYNNVINFFYSVIKNVFFELVYLMTR